MSCPEVSHKVMLVNEGYSMTNVRLLGRLYPDVYTRVRD